MKQVLVFCIQTLATLLKCCSFSSVDQHFVVLLSRLLAVIEQIFSWEFTQQSHILCQLYIIHLLTVLFALYIIQIKFEIDVLFCAL